MIFDSLKNSSLYANEDSKLFAAFSFIKKAISEGIEVGKYAIDGDEIYANVFEYNTKDPSNALFEGHRKYIDVQFVIKGTEEIHIIEADKAKPEVAYDEKIEAGFYSCKKDFSVVTLSEGDFCVFYPCDLHKPGLTHGNEISAVKKIVVKIAF